MTENPGANFGTRLSASVPAPAAGLAGLLPLSEALPAKSDFRTKLSASVPAKRAEALRAIDAQRAARRISITQLAGAAGISERWLTTLRRKPELASARVLTRLRRAIADLAGPPAAPGGALVTASMVGFLAMICFRQGLDFADVCEQLGRRGECTGDPQWRSAARARELALYLVNTIGDVPQREIARAVGLTPAAVCIALARAEGRRDDDAIYTADMLAVTRMVTGREQ